MGIGYELYAKGIDRVSVQSLNVNKCAIKLASIVRKNASNKTKLKALAELQQWIDCINGEMKGIREDITHLEGYKT